MVRNQTTGMAMVTEKEILQCAYLGLDCITLLDYSPATSIAYSASASVSSSMASERSSSAVCDQRERKQHHGRRCSAESVRSQIQYGASLFHFECIVAPLITVHAKQMPLVDRNVIRLHQVQSHFSRTARSPVQWHHNSVKLELIR